MAHQPGGAHIQLFAAVHGAFVLFVLAVDLVGVYVMVTGATVQSGVVGAFVPQVS
jgi:hypothetical protein